MWLFTDIGFFSVVVDASNPDLLVVRSRSAKDIDRLRSKHFPKAIYKATPDRDYPHRIFVLRMEMAVAMSKMVLDMVATNFKDRVKDVDGYGRSGLYGQVWMTMTYLTDLEE